MTTGTTDFTIRSGFSTPMVEIPMPLFAVPYAAPKSICMFIKTIHNRIDLISNYLEFSLFYKTLNLLANDRDMATPRKPKKEAAADAPTSSSPIASYISNIFFFDIKYYIKPSLYFN